MNELAKILQDIENKKFAPVYFLMGEEGYFIDKITDALLQHVLTEDEKAFNMDTFYGKETEIKHVESVAKQFPMMADYRLVVIKEAQAVNKIEDFVSYLENPSLQSVVVFNYRHKKLDKRKALYKKLLASKAVVFTSDKIRDYQLPNFLNSLVLSNKRTITEKAKTMLLDFVGNHLNNIENELNKIFINLPEGSEIDDEIVEKYVGVSKDYNNFELKSAIACKDEAKAYKIARYFSENQKDNPLVLTSFTLYSFFSLLLEFQSIRFHNKQATVAEIAKTLNKNTFALQDVEMASRYYSMRKTSDCMNYLKEFDMKTKGVGANASAPFDILSEFLGKIFQN